MEIIFDAGAAEKLIKHMDRYCRGIQKETKDLYSLMKNPGEWKDNQMTAF